jgi:hypothetical protein
VQARVAEQKRPVEMAVRYTTCRPIRYTSRRRRKLRLQEYIPSPARRPGCCRTEYTVLSTQDNSCPCTSGTLNSSQPERVPVRAEVTRPPDPVRAQVLAPERRLARELATVQLQQRCSFLNPQRVPCP